MFANDLYVKLLFHNEDYKNIIPPNNNAQNLGYLKYILYFIKIKLKLKTK